MAALVVVVATLAITSSVWIAPHVGVPLPGLATAGHPPGGVPQLGPHVQFTVSSTTPTSSPGLGTHPGDTLIVWFTVANRGIVQSITDTAGDTYASIVPTGYTGPYAGSSSLIVWAAFNVHGVASDKVQVTLAPASGSTAAVGAAVVLYDIHGVGASPLDQVGPVLSSYATQKGPSTQFDPYVWAGPSDLVLSGVVSNNIPQWTLAANVHPIASEHTQLTGSPPFSVFTFQEPAGHSWQTMWANATANETVAWVGVALTLMPAAASSSKYSITFTESGLAVGTTWTATLAFSTQTASAPSSITFSERSGTYEYAVDAARYAATPMGGTLSINAGAVSVATKFVAAPPINHVVVIVLENQNAATVLSGAPYQRYLASTYGYGSNFYGACHYSYPNYAAMTSGRYFDCGTVSIPIQGVSNLGDLLEGAGESWMGYFESMSSPCQFASGGSFANYHDPFILYKDIRYNASRCDTHIVNSAAFNSSVANGSLPAFSYYIPNLEDDCEVSSLSFCDHWLEGFLSPILNSTNSAVQNLVASTAFLIVYDESVSGNAGYSSSGYVNAWCQQTTSVALAACGGQVYMTAISPWSKGTNATGDASDYDLQTTVEWLLGVGGDGGWDHTPGFPAMTALFSYTPPAKYSVAFDEKGLSGQRWNVTLTPSKGTAATNSTTGTSNTFQEPNGTYSYRVQAPTGYTATPSSGSVNVSGQNPPSVTVNFAAANRTSSTTYSVEFDETGLTGGNWSVSLKASNGSASSVTSNSTAIIFKEPNGTYSYAVSAPSNCTVAPSSGTVSVSGQNPLAVKVVFVCIPAPIGGPTQVSQIAVLRGSRIL